MSDWHNIFIDGYSFLRVPIACDLCMAGYEGAFQQYLDEFGESPDVLLVPSDAIELATSIVTSSGKAMQIIAATILKPYAWALCGKRGCVWSPGA